MKENSVKMHRVHVEQMVIKKQVCNMVSSLFKYNHFKLKVQ